MKKIKALLISISSYLALLITMIGFFVAKVPEINAILPEIIMFQDGVTNVDNTGVIVFFFFLLQWCIILLIAVIELLFIKSLYMILKNNFKSKTVKHVNFGELIFSSLLWITQIFFIITVMRYSWLGDIRNICAICLAALAITECIIRIIIHRKGKVGAIGQNGQQ